MGVVSHEGPHRRDEVGQVLEGGPDEARQVLIIIRKKEIPGDHDDGRVVDVAQEAAEFHQRAAARRRARRQTQVADHVNVVPVGNR